MDENKPAKLPAKRQVFITLSELEWRQLKSMAALDGMPLGRWGRKKLLEVLGISQ